MGKQVLSFLGENETSEKMEKLLAEKLIIGEPEGSKVEKGPEEREYLLLYYATDERGEDIKSFEFLTGRTETYEFIKNIIESLDIHESKVIVETVTLKEMISVYEFMKHISMLLEDTSFDIEDFNIGDDYEQEV